MYDQFFRVHMLFFGEGNANPHWCSCLRNLMDRKPGRLQSTVSERVGRDSMHRPVTEGQTFRFLLRVAFSGLSPGR